MCGIYIGANFCQNAALPVDTILLSHSERGKGAGGFAVAREGTKADGPIGVSSLNAEGGARRELAAGKDAISQVISDANMASSCIYKPLESGKHRLAVIVPFRDGCATGSQGGGRLANLNEFVPYMQRFLSEQGIDFEIFIVEQVKKGLFNKGFLFNTGFLLAREHFDYVALHDVDQVPENKANKYNYPEGNMPMHLCVANSRTNYEPAYESMVGGVLMMTREQYDAVNGFSNTYWTWGQEDDDMYNRVRGIHGGVRRPSAAVGRYRALEHARVAGLDETPRFRKQREELRRIIAAAAKGKVATQELVMKNGFRQVKYRVVSANCSSYSHYVVDFLNPDIPMENCS